MKKIWSENKTIIIIFSYIALATALIYFLFIPLLKGIELKANEIQEKILDQQIEESRLNKLSLMEENWQVYETGKDSLEVILRSENELEFIENIEAVALKSGCAITLNIGEKSDPDEINKLKRTSQKKNEDEKGIMDSINFTSFFPVQIGLKGDYPSLIKFVKMLENSQIYVNIISFKISKGIAESEKSVADVFSKNKKEEENKKEILNSVINAIVYTQK